jgi:hypothetical protein
VKSSERYEFIKAQVIVIEGVCKEVRLRQSGEISNWRNSKQMARGFGFPLGFQQS